MIRPGTILWVLALSLSTVACSAGGPVASDSAAEPVTADEPVVAEVPRFEQADGALAELIGQPFLAAEPPALVSGTDPSALAGSVAITSTDDNRTYALHWLEQGETVNMVVSTIDAQAERSSWIPVGAWVLHRDADSVLTVGTSVCAAPIHTYDWQNGEFLAITNRAQDTALGAWVMTATGPTPYQAMDTLTCERFVPYRR